MQVDDRMLLLVATKEGVKVHDLATLKVVGEFGKDMGVNLLKTVSSPNASDTSRATVLIGTKYKAADALTGAKLVNKGRVLITDLSWDAENARVVFKEVCRSPPLKSMVDADCLPARDPLAASDSAYEIFALVTNGGLMTFAVNCEASSSKLRRKAEEIEVDEPTPAATPEKSEYQKRFMAMAAAADPGKASELPPPPGAGAAPGTTVSDSFRIFSSASIF